MSRSRISLSGNNQSVPIIHKHVDSHGRDAGYLQYMWIYTTTSKLPTWFPPCAWLSHTPILFLWTSVYLSQVYVHRRGFLELRHDLLYWSSTQSSPPLPSIPRQYCGSRTTWSTVNQLYLSRKRHYWDSATKRSLESGPAGTFEKVLLQTARTCSTNVVA